MANAGGGTITLAKLIRSRPFGRGFAEARAGMPFDPSAFAETSVGAAWKYERGRQLAAVFAGPLRKDRRINPAAVQALILAHRQGAIT